MKIVMEMLDKNSAKPLYEQLYELMRDEILKGRLKEGKKLPSKRSLSDKLQISLITVENAYSQLIAEGYVRSEQRSGYYVQYSGGAVEIPKIESRKENDVPSENSETPLSEGESTFPFSVWTRLNRSIILEKGTELLKNVQNGGAYELREAISGYLYRARGINIPAERIIIGSGTEYLYNLIIQLLGRDKCYGIENPGYPKLPKIYSLNNVKYEYISLDESGMKVDEL
ncbi:MAG: GntR family transcriptional regulator, partial [Oscillospiraceae bacterium]|nr:GntR family transcriptional regulator [Oscillospiraceae bacterium]